MMNKPEENAQKLAAKLDPIPDDFEQELDAAIKKTSDNPDIRADLADLKEAADEGKAARERDDERAESEAARDGGRIPLGTPTLKLEVRDYAKQLGGYEPRWINADGSRVTSALKGGWEPVYRTGYEVSEEINTDMGTWVSQYVGKDDAGAPLRAYLMKIKKAWYDEDQAAKQRQVDETDDVIRRGQVNQQSGDGRYSEVDYKIGK